MPPPYEILYAEVKDLGCPEGASDKVETEPLPPSSEQIGIDVGLKTFAALSNGEFIDNPRFYRKEEKALAKAQRKFDKVKNKHKSKARRKAKKVVRRAAPTKRAPVAKKVVRRAAPAKKAVKRAR